jgi:hypothetical protein
MVNVETSFSPEFENSPLPKMKGFSFAVSDWGIFSTDGQITGYWIR